MDEAPIEHKIILTVSGLTASYRAGSPVLSDLELTLRSGECLAIFGTSGAGKSTLLKCLAGLHRIDRGTLTFKNQVYATENGWRVKPHALRRAVTYVPQEITLLGHYTIHKNLRIALRELISVEATDRIHELLRALLLAEDPTELLARYPDELSGGQRQRVQLARALLVNPSVLLLDEVTSQIDPAASVAVATTLRNIRRLRPDLSIILVTHDRAFALEFSDRHQVLNDGRLFDCSVAEEGGGI